MPIRHVPLNDLTAGHLHDLVARGAREDETLEFKRRLDLESVSSRVDLLQDVVAMANANGGTIIYGAEEGTGDDRGLLAGLPGMRLAPDQVHQTITHLLRDGVDEPIHGLKHRAVPLDADHYAYVVRVLPSPLAPHRVIVKDSRWRYYLRSGTSNNPMNARQVKEAVLRSATAVDRVRTRIEHRADAVRQYASSALTASRPSNGPADPAADASVVLLHLVPLYGQSGGVDLADEHLANRLNETLPHGTGYIGNLRWTLEGLYSESAARGYRDHWALMLRDGALEFGQIGVLSSGLGPSASPFLDAAEFEDAVRQSTGEATRLSQNGWLATPFVLSLRLLNVDGTRLGLRHNIAFGNGRRFMECDIAIEPEIVIEWGPSFDVALRRAFDTVWQAYGFSHSKLSASRA